MKFNVLFLTLGLTFSPATFTQSPLQTELNLIELINQGNVNQFKQTLQAADLNLSEKTTLQPRLLAHATALRTGKVAQLAIQQHQNRKIAGLKAAGLGFLAVPMAGRAISNIRYFMEVLADPQLSIKGESKIWAQLRYCGQLLRGLDNATNLAYTSLFLTGLYIILPLAYQNAHFAYYGTQPLIKEIDSLDQIIAYLNS